MDTIDSLLPLVHLLGLGLALGSATTKLTLLLKASRDPGFLPAFIAVTKSITRLILTGTMMLVASGIAWLMIGYPLGGLLTVKLVLVGAMIGLGMTMDKFIEPRFIALAPAPGQSPSAEFLKFQRGYVAVEWLATGLYYAIVALWLLAF